MILIPPNRSDYFTSDGELTLRAAKYLEALADTTNELVADDVVTRLLAIKPSGASINTEEIAEDEAFRYFKQQSPIKEWNATIQSSSYYSEPWDFVEAQTGVIYLPKYPSNSDGVIVSSGHSSNVIVYGYGNKIKVRNEEDSIQISQQGTSLHFVFFEAGPYWRIV